MVEGKKYVCPNCGAITENAEYCEHCGSLLVRFAAQGININNTPFTDDSLVFPGLVSELKKNVRLQKESDDYIWTDIRWINKNGKEESICVEGYDSEDDQNVELWLHFTFEEPTNRKSPDFNEYALFSKLCSYPLFKCQIDNDGWYYYDLYCGQDVEGLARIISEYLIKVKGITPSDNYGIYTGITDNETSCHDDGYEVWLKEHGFRGDEEDDDEENDEDESQNGNRNNPSQTNFKEDDLNKDGIIEYDMEVFETYFKDIFIQALTNGDDLKGKAESGDATACFQMGMIHLLGINTPMDFKKASCYLGNQSLKDDKNANRLLGFIEECEGNYSQAFKYYASNDKKADEPYIKKVVTERNEFKTYLKKIGLPEAVLNKKITSILDEYHKKGSNNIEAKIKIAIISEDKDSCIDVAQALYKDGNYYSAMKWLKSGNVSESASLYALIEKKLSDSRSGRDLPDIFEVIELDGNSFLASTNKLISYEGIKSLCDDAATLGKKIWCEVVSPMVAEIKKEIEDEETARIKKQEDAEFYKMLMRSRIKNKQKQEDILIEVMLAAPFVLMALGCFNVAIQGDGDLFKRIMIFIFRFSVLALLPWATIRWIAKKVIGFIRKRTGIIVD